MEITIESIKEHWITINRSSFVNHFNEKTFDKSFSYWSGVFRSYAIISKNGTWFDFDQLLNEQKIYLLFMLFWEKNLRTIFGDQNDLTTLKHGKEEVVISTQSDLNNLETVVIDFGNFVELIDITESMVQFSEIIAGNEMIIEKVIKELNKNIEDRKKAKSLNDIYWETFQDKRIKVPESFEINDSDEDFFREIRRTCSELIENKVNFSSMMIEMIETLHSPRANPLKIQRFKEDNEQLMNKFLTDFEEFQDFELDFERILLNFREYFPIDEDEKNIGIASLYLESERNKVLKEINKTLEKSFKNMKRLGTDKDFLNGIVR